MLGGIQSVVIPLKCDQRAQDESDEGEGNGSWFRWGHFRIPVDQGELVRQMSGGVIPRTGEDGTNPTELASVETGLCTTSVSDR